MAACKLSKCLAEDGKVWKCAGGGDLQVEEALSYTWLIGHLSQESFWVFQYGAVDGHALALVFYNYLDPHRFVVVLNVVPDGQGSHLFVWKLKIGESVGHLVEIQVFV